jgi:putative ABC transport system ATP-binding protein
MLELKNLTKKFRTSEIETAALSNVNVKIEQGEFVAVMGPSGCGKSTLLNIVGMLDTPTDGEYIFLDQEVSHYSERQLAQLRKKTLGFIFQSFNLIDELTVFENVELPLLYQGMSTKDRRERVDHVLEKIGIAQRRNHLPQQLSGGQQQRVAVARAVVGKPNLILADEPTGNLDSTNGEEVMELLTKLNSEGTTILMVTHSQRHAEYAHRVINLFDGHIVTENVVRMRRDVSHA